MDRLVQYQGRTVRIEYTTDTGPHSRTGYFFTISPRKLTLLPYPGDKKAVSPTVLNPYPHDEEPEEFEIYCPTKSIESIKELKGA